MFQFIRFSDFFIIHNVSGYSIVSMMSYLALTFTPIVLPISFLLAVLLGLGRFSGDGEILAMRASGISIYSLLAPVLFLGATIGVITLFANFYFVPYGGHMFRYELFRISNTKAVATIHEGTFTEGFFDLVLYADQVDSQDDTLHKVLLYNEIGKSAPVTVVARKGKFINNVQDEQGIPGLVLRLFDGSLHRADPEKDIYEKTDFDVYDIFLRMETSKVIGVEVPKTMDISLLKSKLDYLSEKKKSGAVLDVNDKLDYINYGVEYWKRLALSLACVIFALMGVAFGVIRTRTVRSNSFLICLAVLLFYWGIYSAGYNWASAGVIPAFWGMFAADIVLFLISVFTLIRIAR